MDSEAERRAKVRYQKKVMRQVSLKLNMNQDIDIIDKLDRVDNIQGYIKALIRKDIEKNG